MAAVLILAVVKLAQVLQALEYQKKAQVYPALQVLVVLLRKKDTTLI